MGSKEKEKYKLEKKKLKAQAKLEKAKTAQPPVSIEKSTVYVHKESEKPWFKNPDWIRAIVAVIGLIVTILAYYFLYVR